MQDSVFVQGENSRLASRVSTNRQKRRSEERQTGRKKKQTGRSERRLLVGGSARNQMRCRLNGGERWRRDKSSRDR